MSPRWVTMVLLFLGILVSYIDRGNLSIAASSMMREFGFSPARMGILLSSFFWSYSLAQIPAGYIVDRYGIRNSYFIGLLVWSIASAAIGLASGFWQVVSLRVMLGFGEAIAPVASIAYIKRNFAENEQGLPTGIYVGGALVGPAIGAFAGGALIDAIGWRLLFAATGLLGCLWLIPWRIWAPAEMGVAAGRSAEPMPWSRAIGTPMFWAITLGAFFYSYYWYFILTWVPAYLVNERGFSNFRMGATLGLPLAGTALTSLAAGAVADRAIRRVGSPLLVRKLFVAGGFVFGATIVLINVLPSADSILPVFLLSMCGMGFGVSNYWALTQLAAPAPLIGRIFAYQNTIAQLAGVTAPIVTGVLVGVEHRFSLAVLAAGLSPLIAAGAILFFMRQRHVDGFQRLMKAAIVLPLLAFGGSIEKTDIFEAGVGGYAHYRVPAIIVSPKGTVMAFTEARKSLNGDWGVQDILMRRSKDGGRTWDPPRVVAHVDGPIQPNPVAIEQGLDKPGDDTYNNFVPIADTRRRTLHFLFCVEYARCYSMHSGDDGDTFSKPVDITATFEQFRREYPWRVIATGPGHGIQLRNGRLIVPVWMSDGTGGHAHRPSIVSVIYSDDAGKTWKRGDVVVRHPELKNPSETIAAQLSDGRVMLNIRSENAEHRRAISYSRNGATRWTKPVFHDELLEPVCMASLIRAGKTLVFANPHSSEPRDPKKPEGNHVRQNLTVKASSDEGKSWPVSRALEPGLSGYSDLAVGPDGAIYCVYERGSMSGRDTQIRYLTVARFDLDWVAGK